MPSPLARRHHVNHPSDVERIPPPSCPAVLFFGHLSYTYGHVARSHKIARHLVQESSLEAYVVSPCPEFVSGELVERVREILLPGFAPAPGLLPDGLPIDDRVSLVPGVPVASLSAHRGRVLRALVGHLRPSAVVFEGFPLVRPLQAVEECTPALDLLRERYPATLRCGGFNGVPTGMYAVEQAPVIERLLDEALDLLLVYVSEIERDDLFERCPYLRKAEHKVRFVGHVGGTPPEPGAPARQVLATFGGGVDAFRKILLVGEAFLALASRQPGWTLHVVTGGRLPEQGYEEVVRRFQGSPSIRVSRFVEGLSRRLNEYQLIISMGGYNACTELYQASTHGIVLPRVAPRFMEQLEQAEKFRRAGAIDHVVDVEHTSATALAALMERTLATPPPARVPLDMRGAERTARLIVGELARRATRS